MSLTIRLNESDKKMNQAEKHETTWEGLPEKSPFSYPAGISRSGKYNAKMDQQHAHE
jgi:hypothetical protein